MELADNSGTISQGSLKKPHVLGLYAEVGVAGENRTDDESIRHLRQLNFVSVNYKHSHVFCIRIVFGTFRARFVSFFCFAVWTIISRRATEPVIGLMLIAGSDQSGPTGLRFWLGLESMVNWLVGFCAEANRTERVAAGRIIKLYGLSHLADVIGICCGFFVLDDLDFLEKNIAW